jgi:hypothetical protein
VHHTSVEITKVLVGLVHGEHASRAYRQNSLEGNEFEGKSAGTCVDVTGDSEADFNLRAVDSFAPATATHLTQFLDS